MKVRTIKTGTLRCGVWPKPAILVSCLHENSSGGHDDFQKERFRAFLEWCRARYPERTTFILGDHYERLEEKYGAKIAENNWEVDLVLAAEEVIDVPGNHDDVAGIDEQLKTFETRHMYLHHGDALDPACSGRGRLDRMGSLIWGGLQRMGLGRRLEGVRDSLTRWARRRQRTAAKRGDDNAVYVADAERRVAEEGRVLVVSGHTHCPDLVEFDLEGHPGCYYANPGCWVNPRASHAIVIEGTKIWLLEVMDG